MGPSLPHPAHNRQTGCSTSLPSLLAHGSQLPLQKVKQWEPSSHGFALELPDTQGYFLTPPLEQGTGHF